MGKTKDKLQKFKKKITKKIPSFNFGPIHHRSEKDKKAERGTETPPQPITLPPVIIPTVPSTVVDNRIPQLEQQIQQQTVELQDAKEEIKQTQEMIGSYEQCRENGMRLVVDSTVRLQNFSTLNSLQQKAYLDGIYAKLSKNMADLVEKSVPDIELMREIGKCIQDLESNRTRYLTCDGLFENSVFASLLSSGTLLRLTDGSATSAREGKQQAVASAPHSAFFAPPQHASSTSSTILAQSSSNSSIEIESKQTAPGGPIVLLNSGVDDLLSTDEWQHIASPSR